MEIIELIFWIALGIVFYSYIGYGIILFIMVKAKRLLSGIENKKNTHYEPMVTILITAYNEKDYVHQKVKNTYALDYPEDKIQQIWITDGSDDGTPDLLKSYKNISVYHHSERRGKIAAMNRGVKFVNTPIVIFSDANTILGNKSIRKIVQLFSETTVGCVSGEKRIFNNEKDAAVGAGEGFYWKYESRLKQLDAELNSVVGAAGELFAIRTELFNNVESDTILDDFVISLRIAMKGYSIQYNPEAYAIETASLDVKEELKRKIRIAAGGIQAIIRLRGLLNPFKYGILTFQYISHRVLRWTLAPLSLPIIFFLNLSLIQTLEIYQILFIGQLLFYIFSAIGWYFEKSKVHIKIIFIPYYFLVMNYAVFCGFLRYINKTQSVNWERAKRG